MSQSSIEADKGISNADPFYRHGICLRTSLDQSMKSDAGAGHPTPFPKCSALFFLTATPKIIRVNLINATSNLVIPINATGISKLWKFEKVLDMMSSSMRSSGRQGCSTANSLSKDELLILKLNCITYQFVVALFRLNCFSLRVILIGRPITRWHDCLICCLVWLFSMSE